MDDNKSKQPVKVDFGKILRTKKADNKAEEPDERVKLADLPKEVLIERYLSSSGEGKNLGQKVRELENELIKRDEQLNSYSPYEPIFNILRTDEKAVDLLRNYKSGNVQKDEFDDEPESTEDLVYALSHPDSKSGKMLRDFMTNTMGSVMGKYEEQTNKRTDIEKQKESLLSRHPSLTEEDIDNALAKMQNAKLTLEDVILLGNKDAVYRAIAEGSGRETSKQMQNVSKFPDFNGTRSSEPHEEDLGETLLALAEAQRSDGNPLLTQLKVMTQ